VESILEVKTARYIHFSLMVLSLEIQLLSGDASIFLLIGKSLVFSRIIVENMISLYASRIPLRFFKSRK